MTTDYRLPANRGVYFDALYGMNLYHKILPGLVYLYMPELAARLDWNEEDKLWFAFLNGMTQNPITSLRLMENLPQCPPAGAALRKFSEWFNAQWPTLQYDTDRRYGKKETVAAIQCYAKLVDEAGTQVQLFRRGQDFRDIWHRVRTGVRSFGRLTTFSYLEYVYIMGFGADCNDLMFSDDGSRSHRNGMLMLLGQDHHVADRRLGTADMKHEEFDKMCAWLTSEADDYIEQFNTAHPDAEPNVRATRFTFESNLCTFKNHFFGHRYPGVYADMAQSRIEWYDSRGLSQYTAIFKDIRAEKLPKWLRTECYHDKLSMAERAAIFPKTGFPYRGEHFL